MMHQIQIAAEDVRGRWTRWILVAFAALGLRACDAGEAQYEPVFSGREEGSAREYTFAVYPGNNPDLLHQTYDPLLRHLQGMLGDIEFRLVASRDYSAFEARLRAGEFDFALANPYQTLMADDHGYRIFGKMADDENFRGIILVRRDSAIDSPDDLTGRTVSYPAPTALAATMMPQYFLKTQGLELSRTRTRYVGSQDASIASVYEGLSDAGATWPAAWNAYVARHPEAGRALEVRWQTPPLVNNGLVARDSIPDQVENRVAAALLALPRTPEGRRILGLIGTSGFEPADKRDFEPVAVFLRTFEAEIRHPTYDGQIVPDQNRRR